MLGGHLYFFPFAKVLLVLLLETCADSSLRKFVATSFKKLVSGFQNDITNRKWPMNFHGFIRLKLIRIKNSREVISLPT